MRQSDSVIIIPTYNEKENIEKIIRAIFALEKAFHILVIDDGSPDGTAEIVHKLIDTEFQGQLFIEERSGILVPGHVCTGHVLTRGITLPSAHDM